LKGLKVSFSCILKIEQNIIKNKKLYDTGLQTMTFEAGEGLLAT